MLGATRDVRLDADFAELGAQERAGLLDIALALGSLLGDELLDLLVLAGMQALERQVLQLPLDRVDPEPVRQRRVDLERLAAFSSCFCLGRPSRVRML